MKYVHEGREFDVAELAKLIRGHAFEARLEEAHDYAEKMLAAAALLARHEMVVGALDVLAHETISLSDETMETVARGLSDFDTVYGWDVGRWKRIAAAVKQARTALRGEEPPRA